MIRSGRVRIAKGFMSEEYADKNSIPYSEDDVVPVSKANLAAEALNRYNADELAELSRTVELYHRMREAKKYDISDRLRGEIMRWDQSLNVLVSGQIGTWFEREEHRRQRAAYRVAKGGELPYPYQSLAEIL